MGFKEDGNLDSLILHTAYANRFLNICGYHG